MILVKVLTLITDNTEITETNMTAILDLINFIKVWQVGPEGAGTTTKVDDPEAKASKKTTLTPGGTTGSPDPTKEDLAEEQRKIREHDTIAGELDLAAARRHQRMGEEVHRQRPTSQKVGEAVGGLNRFLTDTGSSAASELTRAGGQPPQGPLQSNPGGIGTGQATKINRAKIQKPLGTPGKVPSMSTRLRQNKMPTPKMPMPSGMKALDKLTKAVSEGDVQRVEDSLPKNFIEEMNNPQPVDDVIPHKYTRDDEYEEEEYNIKGRPQSNVRGSKDKSRMRKHGTGVRGIQDIWAKRAKKLEGE